RRRCARRGKRWRDGDRRSARSKRFIGMSDRTEPPSAAAFDELVRRGIDRYGDFERIGSGGMGVVYRAVQRDTGQLVAIKTIHDPSALLHLKNEFRRVADVAHRNLVGLYELVSVSGQWFMV